MKNNRNLFVFIAVIVIIAVAIVLFKSHQNKKGVSKPNRPINDQKIIDTYKTDTVVASKSIKYVINIVEINAMQYDTIRLKTKIYSKKTTKITEFNQAKRLLEGVVIFDTSVDGDQYHPIKSINFRNGKKLTYDDGLDCIFVAYYPQEDILLCEGGHTSDISFNLKNGERTEQTGNPDLFIFSPKRTFRLNSYFGGQECYTYFIQKKSNGQFVKVVQFDEFFEKQTGGWLCRMGDAFWTHENELYFTQDMLGAKEKQFFKAQIIAQ